MVGPFGRQSSGGRLSREVDPRPQTGRGYFAGSAFPTSSITFHVPSPCLRQMVT